MRTNEELMKVLNNLDSAECDMVCEQLSVELIDDFGGLTGSKAVRDVLREFISQLLRASVGQ